MLNKIIDILKDNGLDLNFIPDLPGALVKLFIEEIASKKEIHFLEIKTPNGHWEFPSNNGKGKTAIFKARKVTESVKFFEVICFPETEKVAETAAKKINDKTALVRIKEEFFADMKKIKPCPICGQKAKEYTRTIDSSLAWSLIALYKANLENPEQEYHHVNQLIKTFSSSGMAKLRFWGLVEGKINENRKKKESGLYKITALGTSFAEQKTTVKKYVTTYNNTVLGFTGEQINIIDALGTKFNYQDLMSK